jgi:hypothetical protein
MGASCKVGDNIMFRDWTDVNGKQWAEKILTTEEPDEFKIPALAEDARAGFPAREGTWKWRTGISGCG